VLTFAPYVIGPRFPADNSKKRRAACHRHSGAAQSAPHQTRLPAGP